jgi:hypothetical protein
MLSSIMLTNIVALAVYSLAIILVSFCFLQVLRKCEKMLIDMGWLLCSLKVSHRMLLYGLLVSFSLLEFLAYFWVSLASLQSHQRLAIPGQ